MKIEEIMQKICANIGWVNAREDEWDNLPDNQLIELRTTVYIDMIEFIALMKQLSIELTTGVSINPITRLGLRVLLEAGYEPDPTDTVTTEAKKRLKEISDLIDHKKYRQARKLLREFNALMRHPSLEAMSLQTHIDVIQFFAEGENNA